VSRVFTGNQNIPMPPRPSSSQSDGTNAPRMSQSPMPGQGKKKLKV
jgi:AT-rich interactive domain-containing protein 1